MNKNKQWNYQELQEVKEPQKEDSSKEEELQEEMGDIEK